ncbi:hypothetical protein GT354_31840 [Streptomyces sp. SID3343]|nr:hypothetical protein [Streptomyces sp. SID3343]
MAASSPIRSIAAVLSVPAVGPSVTATGIGAAVPETLDTSADRPADTSGVTPIACRAGVLVTHSRVREHDSGSDSRVPERERPP